MVKRMKKRIKIKKEKGNYIIYCDECRAMINCKTSNQMEQMLKEKVVLCIKCSGKGDR